MLFVFELYFCSNQSTIQSIARIIRQRLQQCIVESNKTHAIPFNIFKDANYHCVKTIGDQTTFQSLIASLGKSIKKSNVLSIGKKMQKAGTSNVLAHISI